jgi:hypothetical protein
MPRKRRRESNPVSIDGLALEEFVDFAPGTLLKALLERDPQALTAAFLEKMTAEQRSVFDRLVNSGDHSPQDVARWAVLAVISTETLLAELKGQRGQLSERAGGGRRARTRKSQKGARKVDPVVPPRRPRRPKES